MFMLYIFYFYLITPLYLSLYSFSLPTFGVPLCSLFYKYIFLARCVLYACSSLLFRPLLNVSSERVQLEIIYKKKHMCLCVPCDLLLFVGVSICCFLHFVLLVLADSSYWYTYLPPTVTQRDSHICTQIRTLDEHIDWLSWLYCLFSVFNFYVIFNIILFINLNF